MKQTEFEILRTKWLFLRARLGYRLIYGIADFKKYIRLINQIDLLGNKIARRTTARYYSVK